MQPDNQGPVESNPAQNQFKQAAEYIRKNIKFIGHNWEAKVREQIENSNQQTSLSLINSLNLFLEDLADLIEQGYYLLRATPALGMSQEHGKFRASFSGYFLPQLLKEFSLLREVLNICLQKEKLLTYDVRFIIDKFLDESTSRAATEFTLVQNKTTADALDKAQQSNYALEHFAAIAAHDLKSPLATITSYLDVLNEEYDAKKDTQHLKYIQLSLEASARMRSLIDSLLSFAKLSTKQKDLESIDLNVIVDFAKKNLADTIKKNSAVIEINPLPVVMGDKDLLTELFQNLMANSIKFKSQNPPHIQISSQSENDYYIIAVKDNGLGFDPKYKEDIFTLYKKLSGKHTGSGIGLATCRKILELHDGKIWAESALGQGSTFYFSLKKVSKH